MALVKDFSTDWVTGLYHLPHWWLTIGDLQCTSRFLCECVFDPIRGRNFMSRL